MHNAPAVSYPVGRSHFQTGVLGLLLVLVPLVVALWQRQLDMSGAPAWMSWCLVLLTGGLALASWWRAPSGRLQWDGSQWTWQSDRAQPLGGRVVVSLDWQRGLLLAFQTSAGTRLWLWLEQRHDPSAWWALRRAVFAGVSTEPVASGVGGAA